MATTVRQAPHEADVVLFTAGSNLASGAIVEYGGAAGAGIVGITLNKIDSGKRGPLALGGVFKVPKVSGVGTAWTEGQAIYYDEVAGNFTTIAAGNNKAGRAVDAAADGDTSGIIELMRI
jgi:predicted RecA/RadA family phage recombinase